MFENKTLQVKRQIPDRCVIVEILIFVPGLLKSALGLQQLLVLHLQLYLVHRQVMDQGMNIFMQQTCLQIMRLQQQRLGP